MPSPDAMRHSYETPLRSIRSEIDLTSAREFRSALPDVALWCRQAMYQEYMERGYLDFTTAGEIANDLDTEAHDNPIGDAFSWNALNVPNGDWTVYDYSNQYHFRIYTVQNGRLEGKRIIKYKADGESRYSGFATLTMEGGVKLWSRFQTDADATYVRLIRDAISWVRQHNAASSGIGASRTNANSDWFSITTHTGATADVKIMTACLSCNSTRLEERTPVALCCDHGAVVADDLTARDVNYAYRYSSARVQEAVGPSLAQMQREADERLASVALSELGSGLVR